MHARLKELELDNNMDWDTQRATLGRAASLGNAHKHHTNILAPHSAPSVDGHNQDVQKAQTQVCQYQGSTQCLQRCPVAQYGGSRADHRAETSNRSLTTRVIAELSVPHVVYRLDSILKCLV